MLHHFSDLFVPDDEADILDHVSRGFRGTWDCTESPQNKPILPLRLYPLSPCHHTKGPESHKTKAQGSHKSPRPDHRVKLPYFKHVWMLLAHQGERTVTGADKTSYKSLCETSSMWNQPSRRQSRKTLQAVMSIQDIKKRQTCAWADHKL